MNMSDQYRHQAKQAFCHAIIAALSALTSEQWQRTGIVMGRGATPLTAITVHMCWHDTNHLAQIAEALGR